MPHIHTEPGQHDTVVSALILRIDDDQPRALLHMHKKLNTLLYIGGHVELNENPWQALQHEISEESGYDLSQLSVLQPKEMLKLVGKSIGKDEVFYVPFAVNTHPIEGQGIDHYHNDIVYAFITDEKPKHVVSNDESSDIRWLTKNELLELDDNEIWQGVREMYLHLFDVIYGLWEPVVPKT